MDNFDDGFDMFNMKEQKKSWMVRCIPYSETTRIGLDYDTKYQHSNKIVVSELLVGEIYKNTVPNLLLFKLEKQNTKQKKQKTYLSIAPEYHKTKTQDVFHIIYLPDRIFKELKIKSGAVSELMRVMGKIKSGTYVKFQPNNRDLFNIDNYQEYLQQQLNANYTSLSLGDTISIPYFDSQIELRIVDLQPENKVTIVDTELTVDFEDSIETMQQMEDLKSIIEAEKTVPVVPVIPVVPVPEEPIVQLSPEELRKARLAAFSKKPSVIVPVEIPIVPIEIPIVPDEDVMPTREQLREIRMKVLQKKEESKVVDVPSPSKPRRKLTLKIKQ